MPLSSFGLSSSCRFEFTKPVAGWADVTQGANQVAYALNNVDLSIWNQVYADVLTIGAGGDAAIDLTSFTNQAGESASLVYALAMIVRVAGTPGGSVRLTPGDTNGLVWFAGSTDGIVIRVGEAFTFAGGGAGTGVTVDPTHKTLKFSNLGAASAAVTFAILGKT